MVLFLNTTEVTYAVIYGLTVNFTGAAFLSYFIVIMGVFILTALLRIPFEFSLLLAMPVVLTIAAFIGQFNMVAGICLIIIAFIFAKNFFFR
jgi:hypothetical protein